MKRGELAKRTGCNIETVRFYENIGLLPNPPRAANGHRIYDLELQRRLTFIMRGRGLGFSIEEIRGLLSLVDQHNYTCDEVKGLTIEHLQSVRQKIMDLKNLEMALNDMSSKCVGGEVPECFVIDMLLAETE